MTKKTQKRKVATKARTHAFVLLDRTGSMADRWKEAVGSVNAYADEIKKASADSKITLACFDTEGFDILRNGVLLSDWKPLGFDEVTPRGGTPLLDAVMKTISIARKARPTRAAFVVMTDGEENSSHEVTKKDVKKALSEISKKGWHTVFLGVDFDAFADKAGVGGTGISGSYVAGTTAASAIQATSGIAANTVSYFTTGVQTVSRIRQYGSK